MLAQTRDFKSGSEIINGVATIQGFEAVFNNIVVVILSFAGIAFFIVFVVGGIKYLTSGGNPEATASARKTLTYGLAGIVLISVAYLILLLIANITGAPITVFKIKYP